MDQQTGGMRGLLRHHAAGLSAGRGGGPGCRAARSAGCCSSQLATRGETAFAVYRPLRRGSEDPEFSMPGQAPGRVVEVRHPWRGQRLQEDTNAEAVQQMVGRGMCDLTGADYPEEAWGARSSMPAMSSALWLSTRSATPVAR